MVVRLILNPKIICFKKRKLFDYNIADMDEHTVAVNVAKQYWGDMYNQVNFTEDEIKDHVKKWMKRMETADKERLIWEQVKRELAKDKDGEETSTSKCGTDCTIL
jgi:hypothetical protein